MIDYLIPSLLLSIVCLDPQAIISLPKESDCKISDGYRSDLSFNRYIRRQLSYSYNEAMF